MTIFSITFHICPDISLYKGLTVLVFYHVLFTLTFGDIEIKATIKLVLRILNWVFKKK
jgi:hypothetical protein